MSILDRIDLIIKNSGLSVRQFELGIEKSNGYLNALKNREGIPQVDVVVRILEKYPEYNMKWLLTGEGSVFNEKKNIVNEPERKYNVNKTIDDLLNEKIESKLNEYKKSIVELTINELDKEILEARSKIIQKNKKNG